MDSQRLKAQLITATAVTLLSAVLLVWVGDAMLSGGGGAPDGLLPVALILNIALILLAWRRSKDLQSALRAKADAEKRLRQTTESDQVTGLANRQGHAAVIAECLANRRGGALLLIDLDNFKAVNDLYGHGAGDELLRAFSDKLLETVPQGAACARIGGDEFAVFLPGQTITIAAQEVAENLLEALSRPIVLERTQAMVSASIGIALADKSCPSVETLFQRSDIAMYEAKRAGKNRYMWFEWEMEHERHRLHQLEAEIRIGISRDEFVPHFQPLLDLQTGALTGFEVLARWQHPERGLLEPAEFIRTAETSALISSLSMSVMRQALVEARDWPAHLKIAVNISPTQFKDPALPQRIMQVLAEVGFPPARLEIELTENSLVEDHALALTTLSSLKNLGITISLDDFGTGYASLAQLKSLPFDRIKIDRSLVATLLEDEQCDAIVVTIANLGQSLQLPVTAEGIESPAIKERLETIGCTDGQGWLFGRAVPGEMIRAMLHAGGGSSSTKAAQAVESGSGVTDLRKSA